MSFALLLYLRVRCELILLPYRIRFYKKQNKVLSAKERSQKDTRLYAGKKFKKLKIYTNLTKRVFHFYKNYFNMLIDQWFS